MGLNNVTLMGRLTAYPELKETQSGKKFVRFCVAIDKRNRNAGADFIDCIAWENRAEFIRNYFKKGEMIAVCGRLDTRTWTNTQGEKRKVIEVVAEDVSFCGTSGGRTNEANIAERPPFTDADAPPIQLDFDGDDDLPF